jgi:hypothetical protein
VNRKVAQVECLLTTASQLEALKFTMNAAATIRDNDMTHKYGVMLKSEHAQWLVMLYEYR